MMGTECIMATLGGDPEPSIPPGFGPFVALALQGIQNNAKSADAHSSSAQAAHCMEKDVEVLEHGSAHGWSDTPASTSGTHSCRRSLRNRPPIDYSQFDLISDEESDVESAEKGVGLVRRRRQLPKGVLRGCAQCADCQKVVARWNPSGARRPVLEEAPVFYPSEEEFKDTLKYIESIRSTAEPYGICRIVPPPSWKPPCLLKEKNIWECSKFCTRVQKVDKLQNRKSSKKGRRGGMMKKRRKLLELEDNNNINHNQTGVQQNQERFGFEPGPEFTLQTFKKYADDFREQYFKKEVPADSPPSVEDIEGEYWRIVEKPTEEIEVVYGADLETGTFGSGFPKSSPEVKYDVEHKYLESGWNLNNLPRLQGSVLSFEGGDISGVLVPWLYVGMCFSSFCWHVEDHHLYSLNYMHWGAPKMWYGVPGKDAVNLEAAMRKHLPDLFEEQPDLLHNLVTQFSTSLLKSEGVPVYRCVQHEGEFVLTFPRAYHAGFNCGFNCAEAVNVAPIDWLPIGQDAVELYRKQARKITVSHDKLLLGAAREAIRAHWDILFLKRNTADNLRWKSMCGLDSTICKSLKARIDLELAQRQNICSPSQSRKMDAEFDSTDRECALCYYDLHLSASGCPCCPGKYTCLVHAKQLCSCDWDKRFFLFRYDINELNMLADALGGKLSAIHRWGVSHLGLSLRSCVKREKDQDSKTPRRVADGPRRSYMSQASTVSLAPSLVCNEQNNNGNKMLDKASLETDTCPFTEQIKSGTISLQEAHMKTEVSCTLNSSVIPEGHKSSLSLPVPSGHSLSSNFATRSLSTAGESVKNTYDLVVFKGSRESSRAGDCISSPGVHHNIPPIMIDQGSNMNPSMESSNNSHRLMASNTNATQFYSYKDQMHVTPETRASVMTEKDSSQASAASSQPFAGTVLRAQSVSQEASPSVFTSKPLIDSSLVKNTYVGLSSGGAHIGHPNFGNQQPSDECLKRKSESLSGSEARGHSAALVQPALGNHNGSGGAHKGLRMANVVHRFKSLVESLEIGVVLSGRLWSSSQAIFPKGFRSRVKYFSIVDPTQMAYYISEILDAGPQGPLFMVTLENCPGELFINVSPAKCWSMVRERLNMEIRRQLSTGRANLPALQPPGSVDGFEMFGLLSPAIVQAIEARDRDRICTEYWRSRPHVVTEDRATAPPQAQGPLHALRGLFQRANRNELLALRSLLVSNISPDDFSRRQATQILDEEIAKQWR
ncbi:Lysine-specific demethylase JMJ703 [Zea mays]|uniref:Lysine-specific demethylase JMJ703 n=5 Tax=Zea mays TaxID=4577 RepID=A0A3L6F489_MAIZE|nr:lysine-specific demethylase JMJ703 isoform X3 [Zea mays]XP_020408305.1 lysine-specific demethylase JMJ703 isoform X3 [Zea mays]XP_035823323.1 lysine-specific demethylase JMJ703 isoform X3 [Zea mays]XP_035823324.1 lysine-specific demethylase JMJ703 isoform X3 [Zea mays]AQK55555.1 Putative lysine-specific demethylase JMJ16 [Zea mays]AQK55556.1 Putative lysine-specific demethylase JMJ16 [Zea mays]AQK55557.1 Putative lysine-specific demethylase JMJ16 [Zea mays]AQK55560.1 Putative lysine-speci|eukprot:XP_020408304.1 lysine-specific demethylase JMJ703 isoform X3 [Zea mays]